jgi:small ligand-binding sensory domain FIST
MADVELLPIPDVAELLGVPVTRVHQLLRDGQLVATRADGVRRIPADLIQDGAVVKHLPAVITQLRDAHYADEEIVGWLFRADESLPGTPIGALRANRGSEVKRRAQVAGY